MSRRITTSLIATLTLVAASLVNSASPANATPEPSTTWNLTLRANPGGDTLSLASGTQVDYVSTTMSVGPDWDGWNHPKKKKITFSAIAPTINLSPAFDDSWQDAIITGTSDTNPDCVKEGSLGKFVVKVPSCIDRVTVQTYMQFGSPLTADTTATTDASSVTFMANGKPVTEANGRETDLTGGTTVTASSLEVAGADVVSASSWITPCVNEDLVAPGDELDIVMAAANGGSAISATQSSSVPWVDWRYDTWDGTASYFVDDWTPLEDIGTGATGTIHLPTSGDFTLTMSADNKLNGTSVLETCPVSGGDEWATPSDTSATNANVNATSESHSLPGATVWSTDINQETMLGDQFGGMFLYPSDVADPTFTAFDASGATNFTGDGSQVMPQAGNFVSAPTRWGSGGSRWATLTLQENGDWSLVTGSMTSSTTTTTTFYDSDLVGVCGGKNIVMAWPTVEASATANPMIAVYCVTKKKKLMTAFDVLASVTEGAEYPLNFVTKIGNPGAKSTFSQSVEIGRNPAASGTEAAFLDLTWNGHLKKSSQIIDSVVVTAVAANGTVTSTPLNSNPLDVHDWDSINLVPGVTAGRWVGLASAYEYNPTIGDYAETYYTVTMSNNATFDFGGAIDATDSAGDPCNVNPVTAISDTRFAYLCDASRVFDSELITAESVGIANVTNHTVVKGERVTNTMSAYSNHVQQVGSWGVDGSGNPVSYWITSANDYTVVTWHLPS